MPFYIFFYLWAGLGEGPLTNDYKYIYKYSLNYGKTQYAV